MAIREIFLNFKKWKEWRMVFNRLLVGICIVLMGLSWGTMGFAAEKSKVGFVDAQEVLDKTQAGQKARGMLEEYVKSRLKILDLDLQEIKMIEEEFRKQKDVLSQEALKTKQENYQKKALKYEKLSVRLNREIQEKQVEVLKIFHKRLRDVLKKLAESQGYLMILDRAEGGVVLYSQGEMDLTEKAVEEYDKMFSN